jgi:hypothetical protein
MVLACKVRHEAYNPAIADVCLLMLLLLLLLLQDRRGCTPRSSTGRF